MLHDFEVGTRIDDLVDAKVGLQTGNNNQFLRLWYEVSTSKVNFHATSIPNSVMSHKKWFPCNKGGAYRKWYGNYDYVVNWENDGQEIRNFTDSKGKVRSRPQNSNYYFREAITWSDITSGGFSMRYRSSGSIHNNVGMSAFSTSHIDLLLILGLMNSPVGDYLLKMLNPTIHLEIGNFNAFPIDIDLFSNKHLKRKIDSCIQLSRQDWDSFETSWDFIRHPLLTHIADDNLSYCRSPIG
ncbi:hypothetical protein ACFP3T_06315 [Lactiplantibacillus dongliensis]|uniref:site-specific DNA-methyltransferase (adenine-specific) n=1 Tax=Lactiplantibacillus dongliensis TaxID=2559919 RepID=A0ABW1R397_9LACO|nr:hypothetical protein [Lactiplantibacillus dongliensis]